MEVIKRIESLAGDNYEYLIFIDRIQILILDTNNNNMTNSIFRAHGFLVDGSFFRQ